MKYLFFFITIVLLGSCGVKVPYTEKIKNEYGLNADKFKKVQFYTSETIILERSDQQDRITTTGKSGELVGSQESMSERIIIPANRKCIFDKINEDGSIEIRFELGAGRVLKFSERQNITNGRLYLNAEWNNGKGELDYGGAVYHAVRNSASAYLMVKLKNFNKTKRKDRVVKGMKVK